MKSSAPGGLIRKAVRFDVKALDDAEPGTFEGYASTFDVDSTGDVIMPGAFTRTLAAHVAKGRSIPVLWQHDTREPIGVTVEAHEDARGLFVKGRLIMELARAREAYALLRADVLGGLSIGFSIPKGGATWDEETGLRRITELRLWEYSLVTFPANEHAELTGVKSADFAALAAELAELRSDVRGLTEALRNGPSAGPVSGKSAGDPSDALAEARELLAEIRKARKGN